MIKRIVRYLLEKIEPPRVIIMPKLIDIEKQIFPVVMVPFNGTMLPFIIKELDGMEIQNCGNFSLIESFSNNIVGSIQPSIEEMVEFSEIQHNICRASMINPSYDEIIELYDKNKTIIESREKLKEIELQLIDLELNGKNREYRELYTQFSSLQILCNLVLPNDFTSYVTSYALQIEKTDIKKLTHDILLNAAILAENGHDNPYDHLDGKFVKHNETDINARAWNVLYEYRKMTNPST